MHILRGQCSHDARGVAAGWRAVVDGAQHAAMWTLAKSSVTFRTIVHEDGTIERWQHPRTAGLEFAETQPG
jgi:hypothetical protein